MSTGSGAFLGCCARPKAGVLMEGGEPPLAGAKEESSFYLKLGVGGGHPGSQARESLPHRQPMELGQGQATELRREEEESCY